MVRRKGCVIWEIPPNYTMLKITAEGLKKAAEDIAEVTEVVGRIVKLVLGMVEIG